MKSCTLLLLLSATVLPATANSKDDPFPRMPGAVLLIGSISPGFLVLSMPNGTSWRLVDVNPGDGTPIYPSLTLDGGAAACGRIKKGGLPRNVTIAIYSVADNRWTEYATGNYAGSVAISADASALAFPADRTIGPGPAPLHIIDLKTGDQSSGPEMSTDGRISWSPDGSRLAYEAFRPSAFVKDEIRVFDRKTRQTVSVGNGYAPAWSPSGEWIAYVDESSKGLILVHPDGTGAKQVTVLAGGIDMVPVWSPDSAQLLLSQFVTENGDADVYLLDLATLKLERKFKNKLPVVGWAEAN